MFTIFNGTRRSIGGTPQKEVQLKIHVDFRQYLKHFKGAKLAVFLAIALHMDKNGWASPSITQLHAETGYDDGTISPALTELCKMTINEQRVMLAVQERSKGRFVKNRYLVLPTGEEIQRYETAPEARKPRPSRKKPSIENPHTEPRPGKQDTVNTDTEPRPGFPNTEKQDTENPVHGIKSPVLVLKSPLMGSEPIPDGIGSADAPPAPMGTSDSSPVNYGSKATEPSLPVGQHEPEPQSEELKSPLPVAQGFPGQLYKHLETGEYEGPYAPSGKVVKAGGSFADGARLPDGAVVVAPDKPAQASNPQGKLFDAWISPIGRDMLPAAFSYKPYMPLFVKLVKEKYTEGDLGCAALLYRAWWFEAGKPILDWEVGVVIKSIRGALALCKRGVNEFQIRQFIKATRKDSFWNDKIIKFGYVLDNLKTEDHPAPPTQPYVSKFDKVMARDAEARRSAEKDKA